MLMRMPRFVVVVVVVNTKEVKLSWVELSKVFDNMNWCLMLFDVWLFDVKRIILEWWIDFSLWSGCGVEMVSRIYFGVRTFLNISTTFPLTLWLPQNFNIDIKESESIKFPKSNDHVVRRRFQRFLNLQYRFIFVIIRVSRFVWCDVWMNCGD